MSNEGKQLEEIKPPSLLDALIPTITLVILLAGSIILYGDAGIEGPIQVALILTSIVAMAIGLKNGHVWADMGRAAVEGIASAMGAIFILLGVGALVGTWSMAGTIATLVHLGVQFLDRHAIGGARVGLHFLVAAQHAELNAGVVADAVIDVSAEGESGFLFAVAGVGMNHEGKEHAGVGRHSDPPAALSVGGDGEKQDAHNE